MIGTMANQIRAAAGQGIAFGSGKKDGTCIYYVAGLCGCNVVPRCAHFAVNLSLCTGAGKCGDQTPQYVQPQELVREQQRMMA